MRIILIIPLLLLVATGFLSGCTVYKIDVQQGNTIEAEKLAQLRTGMSEREVNFLLGSAMLIDPFHSNRWEYVYAFRKGGEDKMKQKRLTLYFKDGVLAKIDKTDYQDKELH